MQAENSHAVGHALLRFAQPTIKHQSGLLDLWVMIWLGHAHGLGLVLDRGLSKLQVRHESAPPQVAESATGKARPSAFRTEPWAGCGNASG
jgi:hypothetical protein